MMLLAAEIIDWTAAGASAGAVAVPSGLIVAASVGTSLVYALIAVRSAVTNEGPATPLGGVMLWACLNAATLAAVCGPKFPSTEVGKPAIVR